MRRLNAGRRVISSKPVSGSLPVCRLPCKSLSRGNTLLLTRATEERERPHSSASAARTRASRRLVPAFAEPDIHSLSRAPEGRHRRLSLCSLPVLEQFEESLGSLIFVAQSANGRTWQPARCMIPFVCSSLGSGFRPPPSGNFLPARSPVALDPRRADTRPFSELRPESPD